MIKNKNRIFLAVMLLVISSPALLSAQDEARTLSFSPESSVTIDGASNRDDWTVTAREFDGHIAVTSGEGQAIPEITGGELVVVVQQMTGGKSSIMDRLMRNALNATQHPEISYQLTSVETEDTGNGTFLCTATGNLTLAGVTQSVEVELTGTQLDSGAYQFTGSYPLNMTDYDIEPPTAMFGALVTSEDVTVNFDLITNQD